MNDKTKNEEILALKTKIKELELKALGLYNENQQYKMEIAPDAMRMKAELNVKLDIARTFIQSGAFPNVTPEQAYVLMQAGKEMGLKEVESLNSLYITPKGKIEPYGKALSTFLTRAGYIIDFQNENQAGVHVRVYHPENGYDFTEIVRTSNPLVSDGYAFKHAPQNKARFHGLRMHLNTRLAHLISSASDLFDNEFLEWKSDQKQLQAAPAGLDLDTMNAEKNKNRILRAIKSRTGDQLMNIREQAIEVDLLSEWEERVDQLEAELLISKQNEE